MSLVDMQKVADLARSDFEFKRETRYLNGVIKLHIADEEHVLRFKDGSLVSVDRDEVPDAECKIVIRGNDEHWAAMLEKFPKPFFQCFQSSAVKHQLHLSNTNETFAYLPALNRLMVLIRNNHHRG